MNWASKLLLLLAVVILCVVPEDLVRQWNVLSLTKLES